MQRAAVFKQDDLPTALMPTDHLQEVLMRNLIPDFSDEKQDIATLDIDDAV